MKRNNCYSCGYCKKEKVKGKTRYYCQDRDCIIDPNEPECKYDD